MTNPEIQQDKKLALFGGKPIRPHPIKTGVEITEGIRRKVMDLLDAGKLSDYYGGPWAHKFEEAFASYHSANHHAVSVNSGTSALHLALTAAGVGPGDEVIVPALCFVAAATAVVQNGGIPVICDAEPDYLTLDTALAKSLVTKKTKAILTVHFWGYPSNTAELRELCDRHGLALIEDCAQALGAPACNKKVGVLSDYATFAFSVRKHIACGEGGMVLCREDEKYNYLRSLSNYGKGPGWDDYWSLGYSYRLAEFPAIVALEGLENLDDEIRARQYAGEYYTNQFRDTGLTVVPEPTWGRSVFFKCPVLLPRDMTEKRKQIIDAISAENVSCRVPHRPLYSVPWLAEYLKGKHAYRGSDECPVVANMHPRLFEIEAGPHLPIEEVQLSKAAVMKVWRYFAPSYLESTNVKR